MKFALTPGKKRLLIYTAIVGGLALFGLIFYGISQYEKAKYKSSSVILTGATSQISILEKEEQTELVKDKLEWYKDIHEVFNKYNIGHALWSYKEMDFDFINQRFDEIRKEIIK